MGLFANLRVLVGSDIGENVRRIRREVEQLRGDFEELADLSESRFRRLNKRARDEGQRATKGEPLDGRALVHPKLAALRARRRTLRAVGGEGEE